MSTILKALKRVDRSAPPPEDLQSWPPRVDTKETLKGRLSEIRQYRKLFWSSILLVAVIGAGWFAYSQKHLFLSAPEPGRTSEKAPIYQAKIHPDPNPAENSAKKKTGPAGRQNVPAATKTEQDPAGAGMPSRILPRIPALQKNQKKPIFTASDRTGSSAQPPAAKPQIPRTQAEVNQEAAPGSPPQGAGASSVKTQTPPPQVSRSYRLLDDDKLKLQAIAWSNEAARRIAVINGHVVREGESVEGFSINQIRREDVIVNDGTESWQLEFKLK